MKYLFILALFASACNKNTIIAPVKNNVLTVNQIIDKTIGNYNCTRVCKTGNAINSYVYDTAFNVNLSISKENDSTLRIDSFKLFYLRYDTALQYYFYYPQSGGGHHFTIDTSFHNIYFSFWNGGLGGGTGCNYNGLKQ